VTLSARRKIGMLPRHIGLPDPHPAGKSLGKEQAAPRGLSFGILIVLLITALGAALSGCAGGRIASPGIGFASPEQALRISAAARPAGIITATARIEIHRNDERLPLKAALMIAGPASLRLESIPVLGPPDFFLSVAADELRVYLPARGTFYQGRATAANIARFFPLPLSPAALVLLLIGQAPVAEPPSFLRGETQEGLYRVDEYAAGRPVRSLWFDPAEHRLQRIRAGAPAEEPLYTADFGDPLRLENAMIPQRVTIHAAGVSLTVRYADVRQLAEEATDPFSLPIPAGIPIVSLD
jgi:hypothetical protein